jgi:predicted dehydrogenase
MNVKPVKTAVVGCGMISDAYLNTMTSKFKILEVVACCDLNKEKAEAAAKKYNIGVMDMEELLQDKSIELVVNLTAAPAHYQIVKTLLNAGKHVYTEKVLSITLEEAKELVELAQEKNLYLGAAPDTFLGAAIQTAKYVVDSGMIGQVTSCYAALSRDFNLFAGLSPIATMPGGGIAFDVGIYYVTALLSILGPVHMVTGIMDTKNPERTHQTIDHLGEAFTMSCENIMSGTLVFNNGVIGNLLFDSNSIMVIPEKPALVIYGTLGMMYMEDPNLFGGEVKVLLKGNNTPFVMQQSHPFQEEFRGVGVAEMAWSLRKGRVNRASKEMAYHALEVLHGIGISSVNKAHYELKSSFVLPQPLPRGFMGGSHFKVIEESAIAD